MMVWIILRLIKTITRDPCRDLVWLVIRSITTILIITIIGVGVSVQSTVYKAHSAHYNDIPMSSNGSLISHSDFDDQDILREHSDQKKKDEVGKYYLTSSIIRDREAIRKSLKTMWTCFLIIIFVFTLDVAYNIFWIASSSDKTCDEYIEDDLGNAIIFIIVRSISLWAWVYPILHSLLGPQIICSVFFT